MALWKLERRVDPPRGVIGERPRIGELLPNAGYVRPWGIQRLPIPHEASGKSRMYQLR